ncbi:MAG: zf-HC2 domain-containing protein, partial [Clostridia bacterium]|nr:zf-HC2 domain-containing protein [Clostridia bacterium]
MTRPSPDPSDAAVRLEALREDLVAYLDGELSAEEAARIERLINEDPQV